MSPRAPLLPLVVLVLGVAVAGCGSGEDEAQDAARPVSIVASTNVYGSVAEAIAGDRADVTSIITSAAQDPHEYEATAQDRLAIDDADLVIENGGGYDPFVDTLLGDRSGGPVVLNAVELSGHAPDEGEEHAHEGEEHAHEGHDHIEGVNEHVWYDTEAIDRVAADLSRQLAALDPEGADGYDQRYRAFAGELDALEEQSAGLRSVGEGKTAVVTEPLPVYLLEAVGLENRTPEEFSEAVEEGADVPPRALQATLDLFDDDVAVLAYNSQTADETTERVRKAAESAGVPVVDFTETLPDGESYVQWQRANVDRLATALSSAR